MVRNKVRTYRKVLHMSQEQLAHKSGVGRSTISEIEAGLKVPTIEVAYRIADALRRPITEVFIWKRD